MITLPESNFNIDINDFEKAFDEVILTKKYKPKIEKYHLLKLIDKIDLYFESKDTIKLDVYKRCNFGVSIKIFEEVLKVYKDGYSQGQIDGDYNDYN